MTVKRAVKEDDCSFGKYCSEHMFVHGAEAEEFRERLEKLEGELDSPNNDECMSKSDLG